MRRNRIIWMVFFILSIITISFYGGSVSYGFFYAMLLIPVASLLYILYVYFCFKIYQYNGGQFVVDEAVPYSFRLINEFHLPFAGIRVRFFSSFSTINDLSDKIEYELLPHTGITRETTIACHYRGEYEIGIKEVEIQDYLRLFKIRFVNNECKKVTVNPKIVTISNPGNLEMDSRDSLKPGSKPDILSREYVAGDDVRYINWNQSAASGKLMTKNRISEEGSGVVIVMDTCRMCDDPHKYLPVENKILELTLAVASFFCSKNVELKECHFYRKLSSEVVDRAKFMNFYKHMSSLVFEPSSTQEVLFKSVYSENSIFDSAAVFMVLPFVSEYAVQMINKLSERNINTVVYVVTDEEENTPVIEKTDFVDFIFISPEAKLEEVLQ